MLNGTFTVTTSTDPRFIPGDSYPLTIDASVELTIVESVTAIIPTAPVGAAAPAPASTDTTTSTGATPATP